MDRLALVTGSTEGIGFAVARALVARGIRVCVHGRTQAKAEAARERLGREGAEHLLESCWGDFSRLQEVRALGHHLLEGMVPDLFIANAGVFMTERVMTEDGMETTLQVNHLAHLELLLTLKPRLKAGSRVLQVASTSHEKVRTVHLDNLDWQRDFTGYGAYALAKLAQVSATLDLAPGLEAQGCRIQALHPGSILTKLQIAGWGGDGNPDPREAVQRILDLALNPEAPVGAWVVGGQSREPNPLLRDPALRAALMDWSLAALGR